MTIRIQRSAEHVRMPWKNGGGETAEIIVFPEGAGLADFGWRVSMATVASDGPFSTFPGIDRTLTVLSGERIDLDIEGLGERSLTPVTPPLSFPADKATYARLRGGPIIDLNVMTRRGAFVSRMMRGYLSHRPPPCSKVGWRMLIALGELDLKVNKRPERLQRHDVLLCDREDASVSVEAFGSFIAIEIDAL